MNSVQLQINGTRPRSFVNYQYFTKAWHGPYLNYWAKIRRARIYAHLNGAMTERLNLATDKNRMVACEQLMLR